MVDDLAHRQAVYWRDLVVDSAEQVPQGVVIVDEARGPDVEVVGALHEVGDPRQAIECHGRGVGPSRGLAAQVVRTGRGSGALLEFRRDEEVQPIADDRATDVEAVLLDLERRGAEKLAYERQSKHVR